jgi:hypothetical protein
LMPFFKLKKKYCFIKKNLSGKRNCLINRRAFDKSIAYKK